MAGAVARASAEQERRLPAFAEQQQPQRDEQERRCQFAPREAEDFADPPPKPPEGEAAAHVEQHQGHRQLGRGLENRQMRRGNCHHFEPAVGHYGDQHVGQRFGRLRAQQQSYQ